MEKETPSYTKWMFAAAPTNFATNPLSTFIPLYILFLSGTVANVAITVIIYYFVIILSYFFWGKTADIIKSRKKVILTSYGMITVLLTLLFFTHNFSFIAIIYALIGFFAAAISTYLNLLVIETGASENWARNFALLQTVENIGMVAGLVVGSVITNFVPLNYFIIILASSSLLSVVLGSILIKEARIEADKSLLKHFNRTVLEVAVFPFHFITTRRSKDNSGGVMRGIRFLIGGMGTYMGLFYISYFMFSASSTIYNADYPAILHLQGITESNVFLVILAAMALQTILFYYADRFLDKREFFKMTIGSLAVRCILFFLVALSFFYLINSNLFYANLILYALSAGLMYPIYYIASYTQFFDAIRGRDRGNALGTYGGLASIGSFIGSVLAGVIAVYGMYYLIYVVGAIMVALSLYSFYLIPGAKSKHHPMLQPSS